MNTRKLTRVAKVVDNTMGKKVYRHVQLAQHVVAPGVCAYFQLGIGHARISDALTTVQYFDPAAATERKFFDANASGDIDREFLFTSLDSKLTLRNNNKHDALLRLYCLVPKDATNLTSITLFSEGLDSRTTQTNPETYPGSYLTDSNLLMDMYSIVSTKKVVIEPGKECTMKYHHGPFSYNTAERTVQGLDSDFNPKWGAHIYVWQLMGRAVNSDSSTSTVGLGPASVLSTLSTTLKMTYDAGGAVDQLDYDPVNQSVISDSKSLNMPSAGLNAYEPVT